MDDFYTEFLQELPLDEWGHPVLPMPEKLGRKEYSRRLLQLQIELVKMQTWARTNGERVLILFEGRDTAGKGGTIQRMREHMNPRFARHVALPAPNETQGGQWYFQRYIEQLPTKVRSPSSTAPGTTVPASNGSWASPPMPRSNASSTRSCPSSSSSSTTASTSSSSGSRSVARSRRRGSSARRSDPLKQWKLSPIDELGADPLGAVHPRRARHVPPHGHVPRIGGGS